MLNSWSQFTSPSCVEDFPPIFWILAQLLRHDCLAIEPFPFSCPFVMGNQSFFQSHVSGFRHNWFEYSTLKTSPSQPMWLTDAHRTYIRTHKLHNDHRLEAGFYDIEGDIPLGLDLRNAPRLVSQMWLVSHILCLKIERPRQKQKRLERQSSPTSKPIHGVFRSFFPYQCPLFFPSATLATQTMINNALCFWGNHSTLHKITVYLPCLIHPWYGSLNPFKSCGAMTNSWPIKFDRGRLVLIEVDVPWQG